MERIVKLRSVWGANVFAPIVIPESGRNLTADEADAIVEACRFTNSLIPPDDIEPSGVTVEVWECLAGQWYYNAIGDYLMLCHSKYGPTSSERAAFVAIADGGGLNLVVLDPKDVVEIAEVPTRKV